MKAGSGGIPKYYLILVWQKSNGICGLCSEAVDPAQASIDHIVPRARGGSDDIDNLQLAHLICNIRASDKPDLYPGDDGRSKPAPIGKRRPRGFGSISKRKDGRWVASLTLDGGKRVQVYASSKADVQQKLAILRERVIAENITATCESDGHLFKYVRTVKPHHFAIYSNPYDLLYCTRCGERKEVEFDRDRM